MQPIRIGMTGPAAIHWMLVSCATVTVVVLGTSRLFAVKATPSLQSAEKKVMLVIDFGEPGTTTKQFDNIPWREQMTVLDAMNEAKHLSPGVQFLYRGSGATALLTQIDDVKNEGSRGKNWIFRVNGKLADRSFGALRLQPQDAIRWEFVKYP